MHRLASMLHSLFCPLNHLQGMEEIRNRKDDKTVCLFYLERVYDNAWEQRDHVVWTGKTEELMAELEAETPEEAFNILNRCLSVTRTASPLLAESPRCRKLLIKLLEVT